MQNRSRRFFYKIRNFHSKSSHREFRLGFLSKTLARLLEISDWPLIYFLTPNWPLVIFCYCAGDLCNGGVSLPGPGRAPRALHVEYPAVFSDFQTTETASNEHFEQLG